MPLSAVSIPSKPVLYFRSALFWAGFTISTAIVGSLIVLMFFMPADFRLRIARQWGTINLWLLKTICKLDYVVQGLENITDRNAIVFCKHQSTWDTMVLHTIIPLGRWVFKRELMIIPVFGWALALTDPIAINRGSGRAAVKQLITQGTEKLQRGKWVIIFPEGTRRAPEAEPRYKIGGGLLAAESGYPVLPIALNAGEFWPRHSFVKWPGTIQLCIGPYIETEGKEASQIVNDCSEWIENKMQEISNRENWKR